MNRDDRKYVRVYYSILDDPKFARVRSDVAILGTWLRMLMIADATWPASADVPRWAKASAVRVLSEAELVDLMPDHQFRIHGLDAERNARSNAARIAARNRWGNAISMPSRAEQSNSRERLNRDSSTGRARAHLRVEPFEEPA